MSPKHLHPNKPLVKLPVQFYLPIMVLTNGCFDLFHAGHLHLFQFASLLGPLTVLVNTDESIRHLKGPNRPVVPGPERIAIVRSIRYVHTAYLFNGDLPPFIHAWQPSYWVKCTTAQIPQAELDACRAVNCRLIHFAPAHDISTTKRIELISTRLPID
jgi:cytidyltransferase-like protein